jgi:amino acid transporter
VAGAQGVVSALIASGYSVNATEITIGLSLIFIGFMVLGNLRGIREAGTVFSIPTYAFLIGITGMIITGIIKFSTGSLHADATPPVLIASEPLTLWLIMRAFSAGAVAMSGTEAISKRCASFQSA